MQHKTEQPVRFALYLNRDAASPTFFSLKKFGKVFIVENIEKQN